MTVARSLCQLEQAWVAAIEPATMLERALSQDNPAMGTHRSRRGRIADDDVVPKAVSDLADAAVDIGALLEAGRDRLNLTLSEDDAGDEEPDGARSAVAFAQDRRLEIATAVSSLSDLQLLLELRALAQRRDRDQGGRSWLDWWDVVSGWVSRLVAALLRTDKALADCWRELSERPHVQVGTASVGRLRVRDTASRPGEASAPGRESRLPLRPVPMPERGDH